MSSLQQYRHKISVTGYPKPLDIDIGICLKNAHSPNKMRNTTLYGYAISVEP